MDSSYNKFWDALAIILAGIVSIFILLMIVGGLSAAFQVLFP